MTYSYRREIDSVSGLPSGPPAKKGLPLEEDLRGYATFAKPEDDIREESIENESIYRRESPDALLKERDVIDTREDNADSSISYYGLGEWDKKPKYPYRDGIPNVNSSAPFVSELWKLESNHNNKVSAKIVDILLELNPNVTQRSKSCSVTLKRADIKNLRWIFAVDCGNGVKAVKVKAYRKSNVVKLPIMDLDLSCSCHAWRWLGSEHHAVTESYLDGKPRGTASPPVIKDPLMHNRVCKHVAAVIGFVKKWQIPVK